VSGWRLVGDVGGTNARFARAGGSVIAERRTYAVPEYVTFYDALRRYLAETGGAEGCTSGAIGVAGPVDGGYVKLTNAPWIIDAKETARLLGGVPTDLVNDLQAVAAGVPYLTDKDLRNLGAARAQGAHRTMLALNVGTGFGAAAAIPTRGGWTNCGCEPGHMSLGAVNADELSVLADGFPSVEHALSGRGVLALYTKLAQRKRVEPSLRNGAEIFASGSTDPVAAETVRYFSRLLGRVAGDLALASGAWGGVFLCGSVVQGWAAVADISEFRDCFEAKGVMTDRMRSIYTGVIEMDDIPLFGLTHLDIDMSARKPQE
jgi:glucokinase